MVKIKFFEDLKFCRELGWDILNKMRKLRKKAVIIITTWDPFLKKDPSIELADGFLLKPFTINYVYDLLHKKGVNLK